jgi:hypothetical protein
MVNLNAVPDTDPCGCCVGIQTLTPRVVYNRPGLDAVRWRVGTYADFYETLLNRIAQVWVDVETGEAGCHGHMQMRRLFPLRELRTRAGDDPTIALLDAWSVVADVLAFYTERIANEGYLRTARELRSVIELARLVGYRRRPGVSASVYLAFTADDTWRGSDPMLVPAGARVQSMPEPSQPPVFFETDEPLPARPEWNVLTPRQARPAYLPLSVADQVDVLYFLGTATNLSANSPLLLVYRERPKQQVLRLVSEVTPDFDKKQTRVELVGARPSKSITSGPIDLNTLVTQLERRPSIPPANASRLTLTPAQTFEKGSAAVDGLLQTFHPYAARVIFEARANAVVSPPSELQSVLTLRVKAAVYANTAPVRMKTQDDGSVVPLEEWGLVETSTPAGIVNLLPGAIDKLKFKILDLDTSYDAILPGTWVVIERPERAKNPNDPLQRVITKVVKVQIVNRTDYNFPARVTRLILRDEWLDKDDTRLSAIRSTAVYAAPEALDLADQPVDDPVCGDEIELDRQIDGLQPGRWLIITGERTAAAEGNPNAAGDDFQVEGVQVSELLMLTSVQQETLYLLDGEVVPPSQVEKVVPPSPVSLPPPAQALPGDKVHTFLKLASPLSYCYKRATVAIRGNVAHATHGEARNEALGSGAGKQVFQTFTLKNAPLTYTAAPNPSGVESSLKVYVNDVRWHEAENLLDLGRADRGYLTHADADEKTCVLFGDGRNGARLPTGSENVRAVYRSGIGRAGNVRPGRLSQLVANTDGLRSVTNPQEASGGADPEGIESTRARTPLAVAALDRLVATVDYADFARLFAGIAKADSVRLPGKHGQFVQVTIAGQDDIPIDGTSDLYRNLLAALEQYGDPYLPIRLVRRELLLLVIAARVRLYPDYLWEKVRPQVEGALFNTFGFDQRQLAQDAYAAEAVAAMQAVPGVEYVDLDLFAAVSENTPPGELAKLGSTLEGVKDRIAAAPDRVIPHTLEPLPAQLVVLSSTVPTTLMLTEVPNA